MKGSMKSRELRFLTILAFTLLLCAVAIAENTEQNVEKTEVLTTLGQRMLKKISVDFRNTPIDDVIRIMAEQADVDIVKSPKVTGNVTATLTNVPLEEALGNILAAQGYGYVSGKNMIRVVPLGEIAEEAEKLDSRIYRITYADVSEVEKALKKFISKRGSLSCNPGTSNIIVTDAESKIKAIDTFIGEIDRITPQVLVEVRIYDITSKDRLDLGVNWLIGSNTTLGTSAGTGEDAKQGTQGGETNPFIRGLLSSNVDKATGSGNTIRFGILNSSLNIDAILRAEQEEICATLLANPRILVLDNEKATFKSVSEIPYQELQETSGGGTIGTTEFREVGVSLEVTPHVTREDMIRLRVMPEFSIATGSVTVGSYLVTSPQPVVDTRKADTTLLVKDGQTIVLGGLRKKEISQQKNKVPLLGDIPLFGGLFSFEGEETITSELVVFITPRIIEESVLSQREAAHFEATEICSPECAPTKVGSCNK
jgi:type IV pilus assembly protein PilQ